MDYKIIALTCGLGNQMFEYAFGRALEKIHKCQILFDKTWFINYKHLFALDKFNLTLNFATEQQINAAKARYTQPTRFIRKIFGLNKQRMNYEKQDFIFDWHLLHAKGYNYYVGFFQNARYFENISQEIRRDFRFDFKLDSFSQERLCAIKEAKNAICIHIRAGDYVKLGWNLGLDYYKKAIDFITARVENPQFFIFGATADKNFIKSLNIQCRDFSEPNAQNSNVLNDMFLMSQCKHKILANSSYSWWAAFLSPYQASLSPNGGGGARGFRFFIFRFHSIHKFIQATKYFKSKNKFHRSHRAKFANNHCSKPLAAWQKRHYSTLLANNRRTLQSKG